MINAAFKIYWNNPIEMTTEVSPQQLEFNIPLGAIIADPSVEVDLSNYYTKPQTDTQITNAVALKADKSYVDSSNASQDAITAIKADKSYVDNQDALLAANISSRTTKAYVDQQDSILSGRIDLKADSNAVTAALSTKADLIGGKIPESQLPTMVDDVLTYDTQPLFPTIGEDGKIYIAKDTNKSFRWTGSSYVELSSGVVLGETSATAYRGDRGKIAYDHTFATGNPHNATTSDIPEGTNLYCTEPRVRMTQLTGINITNTAQLDPTDYLIVGMGKLQGQINTKTSLTLGNTSTTALAGNSTTSVITEGTNLYYTDARVRAAPLTGLVTTNSTAIVATDSVLVALGKTQAQLNNNNPTWVSIFSIAGIETSTVIDAPKSNFQISKINGSIYLRGMLSFKANVSAGTQLFAFSANYAPDTSWFPYGWTYTKETAWGDSNTSILLDFVGSNFNSYLYINLATTSATAGNGTRFHLPPTAICKAAN